jgi:hypothetical protein
MEPFKCHHETHCLTAQVLTFREILFPVPIIAGWKNNAKVQCKCFRANSVTVIDVSSLG